jgi:hypothetical protein
MKSEKKENETDLKERGNPDKKTGLKYGLRMDGMGQERTTEVRSV